MVTSLAVWTQSVSAVFYPHVFFHNLRALNSIANYEKNWQVQQADFFKQQRLTFIFQHLFHIHLSIYHIHQVSTTVRENELPRSLHRSSLVKTIRRPGRFFSTTLSRLWANFLHQTYIAGLVKQLTQYTGRIFSSFQEWANAMARRPSSVCLSVRPSVCKLLRESLLLPGKWPDRDQTFTRWTPGQRASRVCSRSRSKVTWYAHFLGFLEWATPSLTVWFSELHWC